MTKCELCGNAGNKSAIINDFYYRSLCLADYDYLVKQQAPAASQAQYNRDRDYEDNLKDVIQPYNGDGKPSAEFLHLYPEQSKKLFSSDEINEAERS